MNIFNTIETAFTLIGPVIVAAVIVLGVYELGIIIWKHFKRKRDAKVNDKYLTMYWILHHFLGSSRDRPKRVPRKMVASYLSSQDEPDYYYFEIFDEVFKEAVEKCYIKNVKGNWYYISSIGIIHWREILESVTTTLQRRIDNASDQKNNRMETYINESPRFY